MAESNIKNSFENEKNDAVTSVTLFLLGGASSSISSSLLSPGNSDVGVGEEDVGDTGVLTSVLVDCVGVEVAVRENDAIDIDR
mmetsp:Transcript_28073/g.47461  ORF Transcript_28073/g.47461 Transcript_28073/m.47461 type:complete len:83 (+) Transcript_28073:271-519(+)